MSFLYSLITALSPAYVWLSGIVIILSVIGYQISKSIMMFSIIFFIIIFIGFEYGVYPEWVLALSILDMFVFSILEKSHILGLRI